MRKRKAIEPIDGQTNVRYKRYAKRAKKSRRPIASVDVNRKIYNPCVCKKNRASFGVPGSNKPQYCSLCRIPGVVSLGSNLCSCGKHASYNMPGTCIPIYCKNCKVPGAIDIVHPRCPCKVLASFCDIGNPKPLYCKKCRPETAVPVVHLCGCGKYPSYARPNSKKAIWCFTCVDRPPDAIQIRKILCECKKSSPSFGLPGTKKAIWCKQCASMPKNAVNVVHNPCKCGLSKTPHYSALNSKKLEFCAKCRPPKDSKRYGPKCKTCNHIPSYGLPGIKATHCGTCRQKGMVKHPTRKCVQCKQLALYGQTMRLRCEDHKLDTDFNLVEKNCTKCNLPNILNQAGLCAYCEPDAMQRHMKSKEKRVKQLLHAHNLRYKTHDKPVDAKCGKDRPDFLFECVNTVDMLRTESLRDDPLLNTSSTNTPSTFMHIVILEVDENQHKSEKSFCEKTRMFNITQACGGLPTFWIRYNPDPFTLPDGTKSTISDHTREQHLLEWIRYAMQRPPKAFSELVKLFYDGCNNTSTEADIRALPTFDELQSTSMSA